MKTLLALLVLLMAGCANISYHVDDSDRDPAGIYRGTREGSKAVAEIFIVMPEWHSGCYSEAMYSHCISLLFSPVILVDWPLEVVADTVTFPYDIYKEITK
jgi:uncharacterized protein YceK